MGITVDLVNGLITFVDLSYKYGGPGYVNTTPHCIAVVDDFAAQIYFPDVIELQKHAELLIKHAAFSVPSKAVVFVLCFACSRHRQVQFQQQSRRFHDVVSGFKDGFPASRSVMRSPPSCLRSTGTGLLRQEGQQVRSSMESV